MDKLFFVDFDRTLFNTHEFFQDFSTILASEFEINGKYIHEIAHAHNVTRSQVTGIFSAFDTIRERHPEADIEAIKQRAREMMIDRTYTFVDVKEFLQRLNDAGYRMKIITVGTEEYQGFKRELAPELAIFDFIATEKTKSEELDRMKDSFGKYDEVVLIDDRAETFDKHMAKLGIRGVRLKRADGLYSGTPSPYGIEECASLLEVNL